MSKKIDFGSDEEFIRNYEELKSSRKMAELYGCTKNPILRHAKEIGYNVDSNKQYKLSEQDKQDIIAAYYTNQTSTSLAEKYNVSRGMITKIWYDNDLSGKQKGHVGPKEDLTGQTFGFLTVKYPTEERNASGSVMWYCQCNCNLPDCKGFQKACATELKNRAIISCGAVGKKNLEIGQGLNFKDLTGQKFGKLTVIKRVENKIFSNGSAVQWLCRCDCGNETIVLASNLTTGNSQSCGKCGANSHGNLKIAQILKDNNITFEQEKRFDTCKDIACLPFDFYINNQYLIEYDGKQHYDKNSFFGYESTHKHDIIKSKWCKENSIPLIRIPYTHYDDLCLNDLLLESSNFVEK